MPRSVAAALLVLAAAACWWGWLAWDRTYQVDPATGVTSGPYEAWQVIGCVVSLVVLTAVAATRLPLWIVVPLVPVAFTVAWALTAVDGSGLWVIGAVLVLGGTLAGTALVALPTALVARRRT